MTRTQASIGQYGDFSLIHAYVTLLRINGWIQRYVRCARFELVTSQQFLWLNLLVGGVLPATH